MTNPPCYDAAQLAAIQTDAARALVSATAGAGKTAVLVGHIQHLVESGVHPQRIICLTFTNAAARVMEARLGYRVNYCGTLHSWLLRLLNTHGSLIGFAPGVGVVDDEQAEELLADIAAGQRCKWTKDERDAARNDWTQHTFNPTKAQLCVAAYRRRLRESNCLDFDGILHFGKQVVEQMAKRKMWHGIHLLVDEFQDTSDDFMAIYDALPAEKRFYVGDKCQSIFGYLGSDVDNFDREVAGGATVVRMETSYRCAASICRCATALVAAGGGTEKTLPRPGAPAGRAELHEFADMEAECKWIAKTIRELECERDCAILLRTNALCDDYRAVLEGYGLPIARREQRGLPQDWPQVRALVTVLQNPDNDILCESFIAVLRGKAQAALSRREAIAAQVSLNAHCLHLPPDLDAQSAVAYAVGKHPSAESSAKLLASAATLPEDAGVGELLIALAEPEKAASTGGVVVSTVHSAKGMEFSTCFIPAMENGILPSNRDFSDPASLAEARRICYVAITRAKQNCLMSWCRTRRERFGRFEDVARQPSRFAVEAGLT